MIRRKFQHRKHFPRKRGCRSSNTSARVESLEVRQLLSVTAVSDSYQVASSYNPQPTTLDVLSNDYSSYGSMSIVSFGNVAYGSISKIAANPYGTPNHDELSFTPMSGYSGTESFTYTLTDASGSQSTATVTLSITGSTAPVVSSLSTTSGSTSGGTSVTITGTGFGQVSAVMFGGLMASSYTVNSGTSITAISPSHASGTVDITVVTAMGSSSANLNDRFSYQTSGGVATVTNVSPGSETTSGGDTITIIGTNFTGVTAVSFGGTSATNYTVNSPTTITAIAPAHVSGQVDVQVSNAYGTSATSSSDKLMFTTPVMTPAVTSLSSNSGSTAGGAAITILGTNFTNVTQVRFGMVAATSFTLNSSNSITATVPAEAAGTVDVTVTNSAGTSGTTSADQYSFVSQGPIVTGLSTTSGANTGGTAVTITGSNFMGVTGVLFGNVSATNFTLNNPTSITAIAPAESVGVVDVKVQSSYGTSASSSADQFTFTNPPPTVTSLSVSSGLITGGTPITISGSNLSSASGVAFGSVAAASFTVNSNGTITAISPAESVGTVDVTVTSATGTSTSSSADRFTFVNPPPVITGLNVSSGATSGGTSVTISGNRFTGATAVYFGSVQSSSFSVLDDGTIVATSPVEAAGVVDVTVTNSSGTSDVTSADRFTYTNPLPSVSGLSVKSGPTVGGMNVVIQGSNLTQAINVKFGTVPASSFTQNSDGTITAIAPAEAAGTVDVYVTAGSGTSSATSADQFTYISPLPWITSLSTSSGRISGGNSITISGGNFTGTTAVKFGTVVASSFTVNNDGSITAVTPAESVGVVDVTVTNASGVSPTSAADQFTFDSQPPTVTGLDVTSGSVDGGAAVTISGSHFIGATAVSFGAAAATSFTVNSDTSITAIAPAHSPGVVDLTIANGDGTSAITSADHFTFANLPPVVSSLGVNSGSTTGNTTITIAGSHFADATAVRIGSVSAISFTINSDTSITAVVAGQSASTVDVTVTNAGGNSATSTADRFTFADSPPVVTGLDTLQGDPSGGAVVRILGSGFSNATAVSFGGQPATSFSIDGSGVITAVAPQGTIGAVHVAVTNAFGTSSLSSADRFTYTAPGFSTDGSSTAAIPVVDGVTTNSAAAISGTTVTILGANLTGITHVLFGTVQATSFSVVSSNVVTAIVPAQSASLVNITLQSPAGISIPSSASQFGYASSTSVPTISSITSVTGSTDVGNVVSITGQNMQGVTGVSFGGTAAVFIPQSPTTVLAVVPSGVSGTVGISVTNAAGGSSATAPAAQFNTSAVPTGSSTNNLPPVTGGDYIVTSTGIPSFTPSLTFAGTTGPTAVPFQPTIPYFHPQTTNVYTYGNGPGGSGGYSTTTTTDYGNINFSETEVSTDEHGWVEIHKIESKQSFSFYSQSTSNGGPSSGNTLENVWYGFTDTIIGANGTGSTKFNSENWITTWSSSGGNGSSNWSLDEMSNTSSSDNENGDGGVNAGYGNSNTETITQQVMQSSMTDHSSSGTTTSGVTTGQYNDSGSGNDNYNDDNKTLTATGGRDDQIGGSDTWGGQSGGTFTLNPDNSRIVSDTYSGFSSGNDNYSDTSNNTSTTVNGSITVFDSSTSSDTGTDTYSYGGGGSISIAADGTTTSTDNHNDTDSGNDDAKSSDNGWVQDDETLSDGSVVSLHDDFGDSDEDKGHYSDGDTESGGSAGGGTDTFSESEGDDDQYSSSNNLNGTVTSTNSYGTATITTITNGTSDKGDVTEGDSDGDTESLGAGNSDQGDQLVFDQSESSEDDGTVDLRISTTTIGQIGVGNFLNSTEIYTFKDTSKSTSSGDDPGSETDNPNGSFTESDTATDSSTFKDQPQVEDKLDSKDVQTLPDGTVITYETHNDDSDAITETDTSGDTDSGSSQSGAGGSSTTSSDDDTFNDEFDFGDNFSYDDRSSQSTTVPVAGGTLTYGSSSETKDQGTAGEQDTDGGEDNTGNPSTSHESDESDVTNNDNGETDSSNFLEFNVTDPVTGVETTISAHTSAQDKFTDDDEDDLGEQISGGSAAPETDSGHVNVSDDYQNKSDSKISVVGSPSPGMTIDFEQDLTITDSGSDYNDDSYSDSAPGTGSDTDTFGNDDHETISGGGHSNTTWTTSTDDGNGNKSQSTGSDIETNTIQEQLDDGDSGQETDSAVNNQLTGDSESDTETESGLIDSKVTDTTNSHFQMTSADGSGLTTTTTEDNDGSTDTGTIHESEGDTESRGHTLNSSSDNVSGSDDFSNNDETDSHLRLKVQVAGTDSAGDQVNVQESFRIDDSETDAITNDDVQVAGGPNTDTITDTHTTGDSHFIDQLSGTLSGTDPNSGIVTTVTLNDQAADDESGTDENDQTVITTGGSVSSTGGNSSNGGATAGWNINEILTQAGPSGSSVGSPITTTNSGNDSETWTNGVITDLGQSPNVSSTLFSAGVHFAAAAAAPGAAGAPAAPPANPNQGSGWFWQWDWSAFGSGYARSVNPWSANAQPPVDGFDRFLVGAQKTSIVVGGTAGAAAGGLAVGVAVGVPGAATVASTQITTTAAVTFVAKEAAEEVFEQVTGIPALLGPDDIAELIGKGLVKKGVKEGTYQLTEAGVKHFDELADAGEHSAKRASKPSLCFVAGTLVSTEEGLRPIETIREGIRVWAFNHRAKLWQLKRVLETFERDYRADLVSVTAGGETIRATMLHPFWVVSGNDLAERPKRSHLEEPPHGSLIDGRWVDATDLRKGDTLLMQDGSHVCVEKIEHDSAQTVVYNFSVDELRCYAVGNLQLLVHNQNGDETDAARIGPGGGRKHETHGRGSEHSGAAQNQAKDKQEKLRKTLSREETALNDATQELAALKESKGKNIKLILGNKTEAEWIRARQLQLLGRK